MNVRIIDWPVGALILLTGRWIFRAGFSPPPRFDGALLVLLAGSAVYARYALRFARRAVTDRRRLYKELWRRGDPEKPPMLTKTEEHFIVLLGQIKSSPLMNLVTFVVALGALYAKKDHAVFVLVLTRWYLAVRLHVLTALPVRQLAPDLARLPPPVHIPPGATRVDVDVDVRRVHDFIAADRALPFWTVADAEKWLGAVGFIRRGDRWEGAVGLLPALNEDEIGDVRFR